MPLHCFLENATMVTMGIILRVLAVLFLSVFLFDTGSIWAALVLVAIAALGVAVLWPAIRWLLFPHT
jgi:hypothetical protein